MVDYKQILRLRAEGVSQRGIADALGCSRNTVAAVFASAATAGVGFGEVAELGADEVRKLLLPDPSAPVSDRAVPDFAYVHREMGRPSVTLLLLWNEYVARCRHSGEVPYQYSFFNEQYRRWAKATGASMRILRNPGESVEVDWAGDRMVYADPVTGELVNAWLFVAAWSFSAYSYVEAFPDRFLLGLGVSHHHLVDRVRHHDYSKPYSRMVEYLNEMDAAIFLGVGPKERPATVLAALGPKMLELSRDHADGAHSYFVTVEHTAQAREILGPDRVLAPEQMVVVDTDPSRARETARKGMAGYLRAPNYVNNLKRLGFTDGDMTDGGSDRLVDAAATSIQLPPISAVPRCTRTFMSDPLPLRHIMNQGCDIYRSFTLLSRPRAASRSEEGIGRFRLTLTLASGPAPDCQRGSSEVEMDSCEIKPAQLVLPGLFAR